MLLPATGAQYADGARLIVAEGELEHAAYATCASAGAGARPTPTALSTPAAELIAQYVDNSQFPDLPRIAATGVFVPYARRSAQGTPGASAAPDAQSCAAEASALFAASTAQGSGLESEWMDLVAAAFASCAGPTVTVLEAAQQSARTAFMQAHADQLRSVETQFDAEFARAQQRYGGTAG
jgi:hypothetical protein